jgi:type II secretory pathway component GspD/PulD (secretin)
MAMAEQLITTFDSQEAAAESVIEIFQLKNAQAVTLAQAVTTALAEQSATALRTATRPGEKPTQVTVTPEPNSNSVLVRGPKDKVTDALTMIKRLDETGSTAGVQVRVYPLKNGRAADLAPTLGKLFLGMVRQQTYSSRATDTATFAAAADERTNSLVVSATPAHFALVEEILRTLDKADEVPAHNVQYVALKNANAEDVVDKLKAMYADRKGADKPVIESDRYANAVTIIGKDADVKAMEPIITKLDEAAKDTSLQVRVIPLSRMRAEKMATLLQRVYGQVTGGDVDVTDKLPERAEAPAAGAPKPLTPPVTPKGAPGESGPQGAAAAPAPAAAPKDAAPAASPDRPRVTIAVDKNSNSLIVSGTRQELANLQSLIDQLLPTSGSEEAELRVFKIEKGDPVAVARTIDDLFNPRMTVQQPGVAPQMRIPGQRGQPQPAMAAPPQPSVVVVPDIHTKSILVRAKPMELELIEPLIKHLDQVSTVVSELRVFALKNTDATEVADRKSTRLNSSH